MNKGGYSNIYQRQQESKLNKSSSASDIRSSNISQEKWKSKLKRFMLHQNLVHYDVPRGMKFPHIVIDF